MAEKSNLDESLFEHYNFLVEKGHDIVRLDKFLMLRLANKSRNRIHISKDNIIIKTKIGPFNSNENPILTPKRKK